MARNRPPFDRDREFVATTVIELSYCTIDPGQSFPKDMVNERLLRLLYEQRRIAFKPEVASKPVSKDNSLVASLISKVKDTSYSYPKAYKEVKSVFSDVPHPISRTNLVSFLETKK